MLKIRFLLCCFIEEYRVCILLSGGDENLNFLIAHYFFDKILIVAIRFVVKTPIFFNVAPHSVINPALDTIFWII